MIKTIVIGAGVMGASVAYRLAQAGAAVTVLEATRIGGGTSGTSFGWAEASAPSIPPNIAKLATSRMIVVTIKGHP